MKGLFLGLLVSLAGCQSLYEVSYADPEQKQAIMDPGYFSLPVSNDKSVYKIIDTSAVYIAHPATSVFDKYRSLKFAANSEVIFVEKPSDFLEVKDFQIYPQSPQIGRYRVNGKQIELEHFHRNGPLIKKYSRISLKGIISGDSIQIQEEGSSHLYIKSNIYSFVGGRLTRVK